MNDTAETTRTIEQILTNRLRAAQLRVLERDLAVIKQQERIEQGRAAREDAEYAKLTNARGLALENVALVQREIDAQRGHAAEPVTYEPSSTFALTRYAAILMQDNPDLDAETAMAMARIDEHARFEEYYARTQDDSDLSDLDEDDPNL